MDGAPASVSLWCGECEDTPVAIKCEQCDEFFCRPCYGAQHRRGKRCTHTYTEIEADMLPQPLVPAGQAQGGSGGASISSYNADTAKNTFSEIPPAPEPEPEAVSQGSSADTAAIHDDETTALTTKVGALAERCKWIPLRLSSVERELLSFLEGALHVSEYTDKVDVMSRYNLASRIIGQMEDFCAMHSGLVVCKNFKKGSRFIGGGFSENGGVFQLTFEAGRRYKIMSPQKMRADYGKLMYMLMDWATPGVVREMNFEAILPILTVFAFLKGKDALAVLAHPDLATATRDVSAKGMTRNEADLSLAEKRRCVKLICDAFASPKITADEILRCLDSIADSNNFLNHNAVPVERMIEKLTSNFSPDKDVAGFSLKIGGGDSGRSASYSKYGLYGSSFSRGSSKLSHSHSMQYTYVWQTLSLWREISDSMYKLWIMADADMLSTRNTYRLWNTGQGMNRVQSCPNVGSEMSDILRRVQRRCGSWVGLSVVHLGDRDVPNALMFIDKYTQIARILGPIVHTIEKLDGPRRTIALKRS